MTNHRNKQNYRFRIWKFRDRYHLKGGVCQCCFLSLILKYRVGVIKFVIVINCNLITFSKVIACNCN